MRCTQQAHNVSVQWKHQRQQQAKHKYLEFTVGKILIQIRQVNHAQSGIILKDKDSSKRHIMQAPRCKLIPETWRTECSSSNPASRAITEHAEHLPRQRSGSPRPPPARAASRSPSPPYSSTQRAGLVSHQHPDNADRESISNGEGDRADDSLARHTALPEHERERNVTNTCRSAKESQLRGRTPR